MHHTSRHPLSCRPRQRGARGSAPRSLTLAHGRRPKNAGKEAAGEGAGAYAAFPAADELPPELAAKAGEIADLLPDPGNPPDNLLDDSECLGVHGRRGLGDGGLQMGAGARPR